jgi:hypothetical protein
MGYFFLEVVVIVALQFFWQRLSGPKVTAQTELERIAGLQQAAMARRAEYAAEKARDMLETSPPFSSLPSSSRRQVEEAESAYAMALQTWENRQSRQKSR